MIQPLEHGCSKNKLQEEPRLSKRKPKMGGLPLAQIVEQQFPRYRDHHRVLHEQAFPISPNLLALIFLTKSELNENQRIMLQQSLANRNIQLTAYTYALLRDLFRELFVITRTAVNNPSLVTGTGGWRGHPTFCVMDYGECEGEAGYWVEDDDTGECGFLPEAVPQESDDTFYVFDEEEEAWLVRRFQSRRLRKGSGKGRGRGKGSKGRKRFRPMQKGKSKSKAHVAEEWSYPSEAWQTEETGETAAWSKGKKKGKAKTKKGEPDALATKGGKKGPGKGKGKKTGKGYTVEEGQEESAWQDDAWYQTSEPPVPWEQKSASHHAEVWQESPGWQEGPWGRQESQDSGLYVSGMDAGGHPLCTASVFPVGGCGCQPRAYSCHPGLGLHKSHWLAKGDRSVGQGNQGDTPSSGVAPKLFDLPLRQQPGCQVHAEAEDPLRRWHLDRL